ncbi:hypothetical protein [Paenibacillus sp. GbtcB18]|uniref:hypothetical protein n=1 Tax=Paenibacillus sp. GbtcB18 TaxID=2824763 RepID=UPI001C306C8E|nr:hypothetical protein [Paenibacillus sp. GbtcB18]
MFKYPKIFLRLGITSLFFFSCGYGVANAWSLLSDHWPRNVTYTYSYGSDFSSEGKNSVDRGASPWNLLKNPQFYFQTTSSSNSASVASKNGNNEVFKISNGTNSYLAQTTRWASGSHTTEADIALNVSFLWSNIRCSICLCT